MRLSCVLEVVDFSYVMLRALVVNLSVIPLPEGLQQVVSSFAVVVE